MTSKDASVEVLAASTSTAPLPTVTCVQNLTPGNSWTTDGWRDLTKGREPNQIADPVTKQPEKPYDPAENDHERAEAFRKQIGLPLGV